jgi:hypothetical protein
MNRSCPKSGTIAGEVGVGRIGAGKYTHQALPSNSGRGTINGAAASKARVTIGLGRPHKRESLLAQLLSPHMTN